MSAGVSFFEGVGGLGYAIAFAVVGKNLVVTCRSTGYKRL